MFDEVMNQIYHFLYKTTNNVDGKVYVGVHSTYDLSDGYLGSGKHLKRAIAKHGIENFTKEILEFFSSAEEAFAAESRIVNEEFIGQHNTYNIAIGGKGGNTGNYANPLRSEKISSAATNKVQAITSDGTIIKVDKTDTRWISGELKGMTKGLATMKTATGEILKVNVADKNNVGLVGVTKGMVMAKNKVTGERVRVTKEEFDSREELVGSTHGDTQSNESNRKRSISQKGKIIVHTRVSCLMCKRNTTLTNFNRWCLTRCYNLA